jgi:MATE family multidrug resistance protein
MCGVYLNRGRFVLILVFIPLAVILAFSKSFFLAIDMDRETAEVAGTYILYLIPGVFL